MTEPSLVRSVLWRTVLGPEEVEDGQKCGGNEESWDTRSLSSTVLLLLAPVITLSVLVTFPSGGWWTCSNTSLSVETAELLNVRKVTRKRQLVTWYLEFLLLPFKLKRDFRRPEKPLLRLRMCVVVIPNCSSGELSVSSTSAFQSSRRGLEVISQHCRDSRFLFIEDRVGWCWRPAIGSLASGCIRLSMSSLKCVLTTVTSLSNITETRSFTCCC